MMMSNDVQGQKKGEKNLKCCVWRNISVEGITPLFIKFRFESNRYELLFTDVTRTWFERLEGQDIEQRNKEINPTIEVPLVKLLRHLEEVLRERNQGTIYTLTPCSKAISSQEGAVLTAAFNFVGLPFTWKFYGKPVDHEMVSDHLTGPMMTMICHLNYQRDQLFRLLKNKDREILDLKSQGIQASRKNLETKTFDQAVFINEMLSSKEFEDQVRSVGRNIFTAQDQQLYDALMTKSECLKEAAEEDKMSDGSSRPTLSTDGRSSLANNKAAGPRTATATTASPNTSPVKSLSKQEDSKAIEQLRRQELEAKLAEREDKEQKKKKKKMKF